MENYKKELKNYFTKLDKKVILNCSPSVIVEEWWLTFGTPLVDIFTDGHYDKWVQMIRDLQKKYRLENFI